VHAIFVGYRRLYPNDPDNFLTRVVTRKQLAATFMSASRRGAHGESIKALKKLYKYTPKYAKWNPVPQNMQSRTPEKSLPRFSDKSLRFRVQGLGCRV